MTRRLGLIGLAAASLSMMSCEAVKDVKDKIAGLLNPLVGQGIVLGIEAPDSDLIDLSTTKYKEGTSVNIFLADAKELDDMENAPVSGADVVVDGNIEVSVDEGATDGLYAINPGDTDLAYTDNQEWTVTITRTPEEGDAIVSTVNMALPVGADLVVPATHEANTDLVVNFPAGFHAALIVVLDANGSITYSNEPQDIKGVYDFATGDDEITEETIPGTAFPGDSAYLVGVAPMVHTLAEDIDSMNTALSKFFTGKMSFYATVVGVP